MRTRSVSESSRRPNYAAMASSIPKDAGEPSKRHIVSPAWTDEEDSSADGHDWRAALREADASTSRRGSAQAASRGKAPAVVSRLPLHRVGLGSSKHAAAESDLPSVDLSSRASRRASASAVRSSGRGTKPSEGGSGRLEPKTSFRTTGSSLQRTLRDAQGSKGSDFVLEGATQVVSPRGILADTPGVRRAQQSPRITITTPSPAMRDDDMYARVTPRVELEPVARTPRDGSRQASGSKDRRRSAPAMRSPADNRHGSRRHVGRMTRRGTESDAHRERRRSRRRPESPAAAVHRNSEDRPPPFSARFRAQFPSQRDGSASNLWDAEHGASALLGSVSTVMTGGSGGGGAGSSASVSSSRVVEMSELAIPTAQQLSVRERLSAQAKLTKQDKLKLIERYKRRPVVAKLSMLFFMVARISASGWRARWKIEQARGISRVAFTRRGSTPWPTDPNELFRLRRAYNRKRMGRRWSPSFAPLSEEKANAARPIAEWWLYWARCWLAAGGLEDYYAHVAPGMPPAEAASRIACGELTVPSSGQLRRTDTAISEMAFAAMAEERSFTEDLKYEPDYALMPEAGASPTVRSPMWSTSMSLDGSGNRTPGTASGWFFSEELADPAFDMPGWVFHQDAYGDWYAMPDSALISGQYTSSDKTPSDAANSSSGIGVVSGGPAVDLLDALSTDSDSDGGGPRAPVDRQIERLLDVAGMSGGSRRGRPGRTETDATEDGLPEGNIRPEDVKAIAEAAQRAMASVKLDDETSEAVVEEAAAASKGTKTAAKIASAAASPSTPTADAARIRQPEVSPVGADDRAGHDGPRDAHEPGDSTAQRDREGGSDKAAAAAPEKSGLLPSLPSTQQVVGDGLLPVEKITETLPTQYPTHAPSGNKQYLTVAIDDYEAEDENELTFSVGDEIEVITEDPSGWWEGKHVPSGKVGWFPFSFVEWKEADVSLPVESIKNLDTVGEAESVARQTQSAGLWKWNWETEMWEFVDEHGESSHATEDPFSQEYERSHGVAGQGTGAGAGHTGAMDLPSGADDLGQDTDAYYDFHLVKAHTAYTGEDENELTFAVDDVIDVIQEDDSGWWLGKLSRVEGAAEGWFPSSYVDWCDEEGNVWHADEEGNALPGHYGDAEANGGAGGATSDASGGDASPAYAEYDGTEGQYAGYDEYGGEWGADGTYSDAASVARAARLDDASQINFDRFVVALADYEGQEEGELAFWAGDLIEVLGKDDSGWWNGIVVDTRAEGWFPVTFVAQSVADVQEFAAARSEAEAAAGEGEHVVAAAVEQGEPATAGRTRANGDISNSHSSKDLAGIGASILVSALGGSPRDASSQATKGSSGSHRSLSASRRDIEDVSLDVTSAR